jgi:hypothetical protein
VPHLKFAERAQKEYDTLKGASEQAASTRKQTGKTKASRQEGLFKQICKSLTYLESDPRHPSLNTHKYESFINPWDANVPVFTAYAQNKTSSAYRIFWSYGKGKDQITVLAITPHP